jgi:hypothetical protein
VRLVLEGLRPRSCPFQPVRLRRGPGPMRNRSRRQERRQHSSSAGKINAQTFDIVRDDGRRRIVPYLAPGGGYLRQKTLVGSGPGSTALKPFTSSEGTTSAGVRARLALGSHMFVAARVPPRMGTRNARRRNDRDEIPLTPIA